MTKFLRKIFGLEEKTPMKRDDFSDFINGKSADKTKIMRQVLREATEEQQNIIRKYRETTPASH